MKVNWKNLIAGAIKRLGADPRSGMDNISGPTSAKRGGRRHRGFTKSPYNAAKVKVRRKMADKSRKINRK